MESLAPAPTDSCGSSTGASVALSGNDWQMRSFRSGIVVALIVASAAALSASVATARVQSLVPQQSLRGIKIGMVASQVRAVAGKPSSNKVTGHPLLGKTRTMRFGLVEVIFRGTAATAPVVNLSTTSRNERTGGGIGVGSSEKELAAKLTGERCRTELGYRHCYLGKWSPGFVVTDFSISKAGRVTRITLGLVID